jgi:hypothetical protein
VKIDLEVNLLGWTWRWITLAQPTGPEEEEVLEVSDTSSHHPLGFQGVDDE